MQQAHDDALGSAVVRLVSSTTEDRNERARQVRAVVAAVAASARSAGARAVVGGRWLVDALLDVAAQLPLRDRATLRAQHPGLDDDAIVEALVTAAARASSVVGAVAGAATSVAWTVPPALLVSAPAKVAAETLAVAAVEVKLVAELHALRGVVPSGGTAQRAQAYVMSWAEGRGVDPSDPKWLVAGLSAVARGQVKRRMAERATRGVATLGPVMTGAVAGYLLNGRATRSLAEKIDEDLRSLVWRA